MMYRVKLDFFEGPLDLLLHLVRKNEVDIFDIPIATITHQYLEYLGWIKEMNLEVAGDFLLMAATLIQIKARMLLPSTPDEINEDEEEGADPRRELLLRLAEYQQFREAGQMLEKQHQLERDVFLRAGISQYLTEAGFKTVTVFALVDAFRLLLEKLEKDDALTVDTAELSVRDKMRELMEKLRQNRELRF